MSWKRERNENTRIRRSTPNGRPQHHKCANLWAMSYIIFFYGCLCWALQTHTCRESLLLPGMLQAVWLRSRGVCPSTGWTCLFVSMEWLPPVINLCAKTITKQSKHLFTIHQNWAKIPSNSHFTQHTQKEKTNTVGLYIIDILQRPKTSVQQKLINNWLTRYSYKRPSTWQLCLIYQSKIHPRTFIHILNKRTTIFVR